MGAILYSSNGREVSPCGRSHQADAMRIEFECPQTPVIHGDALSISIAAASIIAREGFINWLERKGKELGMRLERGVSPGVKETSKRLVEAGGPEALREVAKIHFRTANEIAPDYYAAPPPRQEWRRRTSRKE